MIIMIVIIILFFVFPVTPFTGSETDLRVTGSPVDCLKEVADSATLNPFCYPNSYWAEL